MSKNVVKSDASGKKGILSCCKSLFEKIGTTLVHSSLKIPEMSKNGFLAKSSESQWVNTIKFFCTMRCIFVMFVTAVCFVLLLIPDEINV